MFKGLYLFFALLFFVGVLFLFSGCSASVSPDSLSNSFTVSVSPSPTPPVYPVSSSCYPVRLAKVFDQSGSMGWTNTKRVSLEELKPVFSLLLRCGGEIGVTFIRSESNRPLFRFFVPEPSVEPIFTPRSEDEEPYKFTDRKKKFEKEHSDWEKAKSERQNIYASKFDEFLKEIEPVLNAEQKGGTDFWGALHRANIMLSESEVIWNTEPHSYLVLVSDGVDTVGKPKVVLDEKINVLWVDSKTDDSILKKLHAERYESFDRALASILAIEGRQKDGRR